MIALALAGPASAQWEPIAVSQGDEQISPVMDHFRNVTAFSVRESGGDGPGSDRYF